MLFIRFQTPSSGIKRSQNNFVAPEILINLINFLLCWKLTEQAQTWPDKS